MHPSQGVPHNWGKSSQRLQLHKTSQWHCSSENKWVFALLWISWKSNNTSCTGEQVDLLAFPPVCLPLHVQSFDGLDGIVAGGIHAPAYLLSRFLDWCLTRLGPDRNKLHLWCSQGSRGGSFTTSVPLLIGANFGLNVLQETMSFMMIQESKNLVIMCLLISFLGSNLWPKWVSGRCGRKWSDVWPGHDLRRGQWERQLPCKEEKNAKSFIKLRRATAEELWQWTGFWPALWAVEDRTAVPRWQGLSSPDSTLFVRRLCLTSTLMWLPSWSGSMEQ